MIASSYLLHPLSGLGYQFFSGIGSSISEWISVIVLVSVFLYKHNCHQHRCLRIAYHMREGRPICKRHDPEHPSEGIIRNMLKRLHLRGATPGRFVMFHYTKKHTEEARKYRTGMP